MVIDSSKI